MELAITTHSADAIGWIFALTSAARIAAYLPQLALLVRSSDGAGSVSLITWISAAVSHSAAVVYGIWVLFDFCFAAIAAGNAIGSAAIAGLVLMRRFPTYWARDALHV